MGFASSTRLSDPTGRPFRLATSFRDVYPFSTGRMVFYVLAQMVWCRFGPLSGVRLKFEWFYNCYGAETCSRDFSRDATTKCATWCLELTSMRLFSRLVRVAPLNPSWTRSCGTRVVKSAYECRARFDPLCRTEDQTTTSLCTCYAILKHHCMHQRLDFHLCIIGLQAAARADYSRDRTQDGDHGSYATP